MSHQSVRIHALAQASALKVGAHFSIRLGRIHCECKEARICTNSALRRTDLFEWLLQWPMHALCQTRLSVRDPAAATVTDRFTSKHTHAHALGPASLEDARRTLRSPAVSDERSSRRPSARRTDRDVLIAHAIDEVCTAAVVLIREQHTEIELARIRLGAAILRTYKLERARRKQFWSSLARRLLEVPACSPRTCAGRSRAALETASADRLASLQAVQTTS